MSKKWYSHKVKKEQAEKLELTYARIVKAEYGLLAIGFGRPGGLGLNLELRLAKSGTVQKEFSEPIDIAQSVCQSSKTYVSELRGLIVEAYLKDRFLYCISIDKNLIHRADDE